MRRVNRLRERNRFQQVRHEGRCWTEAYVVMCALPNGKAYSRFGFSVSKRIGKAVVRNRVRRRLREAIRLRRTAIAPGWDVVFVARAPSAEATYHQLAQACERVLRRAQLLEPVEPSIQHAHSQSPHAQGILDPDQVKSLP